MEELSVPELKLFLDINSGVVAVYKPRPETKDLTGEPPKIDCIFFRQALLLDQRDIALARMIAAAPKMYLMLNKLALSIDSIELFNEAQDLIKEVRGK